MVTPIFSAVCQPHALHDLTDNMSSGPSVWSRGRADLCSCKHLTGRDGGIVSMCINLCVFVCMYRCAFGCIILWQMHVCVCGLISPFCVCM